MSKTNDAANIRRRVMPHPSIKQTSAVTAPSQRRPSHNGISPWSGTRRLLLHLAANEQDFRELNIERGTCSRDKLVQCSLYARARVRCYTIHDFPRGMYHHMAMVACKSCCRVVFCLSTWRRLQYLIVTHSYTPILCLFFSETLLCSNSVACVVVHRTLFARALALALCLTTLTCTRTCTASTSDLCLGISHIVHLLELQINSPPATSHKAIPEETAEEGDEDEGEYDGVDVLHRGVAGYRTRLMACKA